MAMKAWPLPGLLARITESSLPDESELKRQTTYSLEIVLGLTL